MQQHPTTVSCACGATYSRILVQLPIKDVGEFTCFVCGNVMEQWRGRVVPKFKRLEQAKPGV